jgi:site-specific DNA-methyltransferase (adenine-specific)
MSDAIHNADFLCVLPSLTAASVDAVVTDPPYDLTTIGRTLQLRGASVNPRTGRVRSNRRRQAKGFMGQSWDGTGVAFRAETWAAVLRVLKPGGHLLAFGGPRTYHRMTCAIEDGGFEVRDCLLWLYGQGFPKSLDVSKAIDKAAGAKRDRIRGVRSGVVGSTYASDQGSLAYKDSVLCEEPITEDAARWRGWGTALKPAWEPIILARKPLSESSVAANVLKHGTGALNIDACRIGTDDVRSRGVRKPGCQRFGGQNHRPHHEGEPAETVHGSACGRWPANVALDEEAASQLGGVSRFFYSAKASRSDRNEGLEGLPEAPLLWSAGTANPGSFQSQGTRKAAQNNHPTVKPTALMRWLCRLVTPPDGTVLDPFAGSGSTGKAALLEGFRFVGVERDPDYFAIMKCRLKAAKVKSEL